MPVTKYFSKHAIALYFAWLWIIHLIPCLVFHPGDPLYILLSYGLVTSFAVMRGIYIIFYDPPPIPQHIPEPIGEDANEPEEFTKTNVSKFIGLHALVILPGLWVWSLYNLHTPEVDQMSARYLLAYTVLIILWHKVYVNFPKSNYILY